MEFLINITYKSTIVLLFSGVILLCLKNTSATFRHWIISLTMVGLLCLPILMKIIPSLQVEVPFLPAQNTKTEILEETTEVSVSISPNDTPIKPSPTENQVSNIKNSHIEEVAAEKSDSQLIMTDTGKNGLPNFFLFLPEILWILWLTIGSFLFLKFCLGLLKIRNVTINSWGFVLPDNLENYAKQFTKKEVRFLQSDAINTPMTWGGFSPVVLLPIGAKDWSTEALKTVLLHELSHIKRRDYWIHTLGLLAVCFYWYNPLIWLMKKQQLLEREKACDEAVLQAGIRQHNYAEQLVEIARQLSGRTPMISENALPMAKISQTKARILAILNFDQHRFSFPKWKQRNWGIFYSVLLPFLAAFSPVGEKLIQKHIVLPEIATLSQTLQMEKREIAKSLTEFLATTLDREQAIIKAPKNKLNDSYLFENELFKAVEEPVGMLPKSNGFIPISIPDIAIPPTQRPAKTGLFGTWKEGKSEFKIWTYGEFRFIPTEPYIEVVSPDGIVFIEEYKERLFNGTINQLTIAKAPYDGIFSKNSKKRAVPDQIEYIEKGKPIKIWSENNSYQKWMSEKGSFLTQKINQKRKEGSIYQVTEQHKEWLEMVESIQKEWIPFCFTPFSKFKEKADRKVQKARFDENKILYKKILVKPELGAPKIIGRKDSISTTAFSGTMGINPGGNRYTTVLKGSDKPALIKDFNFHLKENGYKELVFDLYLYNLEDGEVAYSILKNPIPIKIAAGSGWFQKDLSAYNIVTQGDVLVVLKAKKYKGINWKKNLYFSLTEDPKSYQPMFSEGIDRDTKIWENGFMFYLNVEEKIKAISLNDTSFENNQTGYFGKWKDGKSEYKVWTFGEYRLTDKKPYIEPLDANSIVIVEETKNTAFKTKKCLINITKAPYEGALVQSYLNGKPNSWNHGFAADDLLHLWFVDDKWAFLGKGIQEDKWMDENLSKVAQKLSESAVSNDWYIMSQQDGTWWSMIQKQLAIKKERFIPNPEKEAVKERVKIPQILPDAIPYQSINYESTTRKNKKIGRTKLSKWKSGFSGYDDKDTPGMSFGTIIKGGNEPAKLKTINFHLKHNDFDKLSFDLYFFKVAGDEIKFSLQEAPIRLKVDNQKGWIKKDISQYGVISQGDLFVYLKIVDNQAERAGLFFSLAPEHQQYKPTDLKYADQQLSFWNSAFALYMTAE